MSQERREELQEGLQERMEELRRDLQASKEQLARLEGTPENEQAEQPREDDDAKSVSSEASSKKSQQGYQFMPAPTLTPPGPFDFSKPKEWPEYAARFARYIRLSHLRDAAEDIKIDTLLYEMGKAADQAMRTFDPQPATLEATLEAFRKYFRPSHNVIFSRTMFTNRKQGELETAEAFIRGVYDLAEDCDYGTMKEDMIRDRLIAGMKDHRLSNELQLNDSVTVTKVCAKLRQKDQLRAEARVLQNAVKPGTSSSTVDAVHKSGKKWVKSKPHPKYSQGKAPVPTSHVQHRQQPSASTGHQCRRCGKSPRHGLFSCPARHERCTICNKIGHYKHLCFHAHSQTNLREIQHNEEEENPLDCQRYVLGIKESDLQQAWSATLLMGAETNKVNFKIDTGADVSVISMEDYKNLPHKPHLTAARRKLECASGSVLDTVGACKLLIKRPLTSFSVEEVIYVVNNLKHNLLGRSPSEKLGLVTFHGSLRSISMLPEMNSKPQELFPALFTGLGCIKEIYKIKLKDDALPFAIHSPRRVPHKLQTAVKEKLDSMEKSGVIRRVNEPTAWCAGMVVVPKGGKPDFSEG
ncbi:hypothetical protein B566_EDAN017854 [Ephemera danica]|nr:hypothetical protein B566_EDAN017854 [Ephemera danica]